MKAYISNYLTKFSPQEITQEEKKRFKSQRAELIQEIYDVYTYCQKIENWKTYRTIYKEDTKINQDKFKKSNKYFPPWDIKRFVLRLSHIPTEDLFYVLSIARDKKNRKENFSKWIMWATKGE